MLATGVSFEHERARKHWHLHRSDCRNTLIYAHTTLRTLPSCHEPRLANCRHASSQRLCGITRTVRGHGTYKCTPNTVNVFETGITLPGRSEVSLAATAPCRLQLCAVEWGSESSVVS